jgi:hypothetical protein
MKQTRKPIPRWRRESMTKEALRRKLDKATAWSGRSLLSSDQYSGSKPRRP